MWDTERMTCRDRIVEVSRYVDDSLMVQKARQIGESPSVGDPFHVAICGHGRQKTIVFVLNPQIRQLHWPGGTIAGSGDVDAHCRIATITHPAQRVF